MRQKLYVSDIQDQRVQQNFKTIGDLFRLIPFLKGDWRFIQFQITATGTNIKVAHQLSYTPIDVILLSSVNGTIAFDYAKFDDTFIYVTATVTNSPMIVRAFIGRYTEDSINV